MARDRQKTPMLPLLMVSRRGPHPRKASLLVISGLEQGRNVLLEPGSTFIGRSDRADLRFQDEGVSRIHAELILRLSGEALIRDYRSTNGTLVNNAPVTDELVELSDGDRIQLGGKLVLKFNLLDPSADSFRHQLFDSAVKDQHTGVYNRVFLDDRLRQEFDYARHTQRPLAVVLIEPQGFGRVDEDHGVEGGDQLIRVLISRIRRRLGPGDLLAHYENRQFAVLMRDVDLDAAAERLELLEQRVASSPVQVADQEVPVEVALGVASTSEEDIDSSDTLLVRASQRLYASMQASMNSISD